MTIEEEGETERGAFITANIEIIAKICVLRPLDILGALLPTLSAQIVAFLDGEGAKFSDFQILDLGTLLQIAGRLTEHFLGENFSKFLSDGQTVLISLLQLGENLWKKLDAQEPTQVQIELHSQTLASLRPFQHWLSQVFTHFATPTVLLI